MSIENCRQSTRALFFQEWNLGVGLYGIADCALNLGAVVCLFGTNVPQALAKVFHEWQEGTATAFRKGGRRVGAPRAGCA